VPFPDQPPHHVGAHTSETYHSELHKASFFRKSYRRFEQSE
jgi:hypothetical protein